MWDLYKLLGKGFGKDLLVDEVMEILVNTSSHKIQQSLNLMYDSVSSNDPTERLNILIDGLKANKFFDFQNLMETLNGSPK
jgi:hypothetical protein